VLWNVPNRLWVENLSKLDALNASSFVGFVPSRRQHPINAFAKQRCSIHTLADRCSPMGEIEISRTRERMCSRHVSTAAAFKQSAQRLVRAAKLWLETANLKR
jgi:hypothetical protein